MLAVTNIYPESETTEGVSAMEAVEWLKWVAERRDRDSFEKLYGFFAPRINRYMMRQGADEASADDLTQEAMVQVWRKTRHYDPQKAAVTTRIFRVACNLQIDRLRKHKLHKVELTPDAEHNEEGAGSHERFEKRQDADRLKALVGALREEQMDVVRLAFLKDLTIPR